MNFSGKTIWITGASSGIGKAVTMAVASSAKELVISGRNKEALEHIAKMLSSDKLKVNIVPFDLADEKSIFDAYNLVKEKDIKLDALWQFGGLSHRSLVDETDPDVDRRIMEVNFFGTIKLAKLVLPDLVKNGGGQLAVTSSIVGKFGFPYRSAYSASKHALHGYFETIRAENRNNHIKVSIVIPGRVATDISMHALLKDGTPHNKMDKGLENGISVQKAANAILSGLSKEKTEILVGGKELLMVHIRRWFPSLAYKLASKVDPT